MRKLIFAAERFAYGFAIGFVGTAAASLLLIALEV